MHKEKLIKIIGKEAYNDTFECIKDLIENGLSLDRFTDDCQKPNRQDITFFLASWCKHIGLRIDDYREWLIAYCIDVLSGISSSKPSKIRHSTKSAIKYIHKSDTTFSCICEHNIFKATCSNTCPMYTKMNNLYLLKLEKEKQRIEEIKKQNLAIEQEPVELKKEKDIKQFEKTVELIRQYLKKGHRKKEITEMLNKEGYTTITGKKWKVTTLSTFAAQNNLNPEHIKRKKKR